LANCPTDMKGYPKIRIWEPKPHSAKFGSRALTHQQTHLPNDAFLSVNIYVFFYDIRICGCNNAVTLR
jgi:hypothetical protein